jgi:hypothetical protein
MSIAVQVVHTGVVMNQPKQLKPELQEISDLLALREMATTGILTHHSQRELVKGLSPRDMADVARAVSETEKRQQPVFTRNK